MRSLLVLACNAAITTIGPGCRGSSEAPQLTPIAIEGDTSLAIAYRSDPDPPITGKNEVMVSVKQADGTPVNDAKVDVSFHMPAMSSMNMPDMRTDLALSSKGNGVYVAKGELVMSGSWNVTIRVAHGADVATGRFIVIAR